MRERLVMVMPSFQPDKLRAARRLEGITKTELGRRIGVSHAAISQYESGSNMPSPQRLRQLAMALGFPLEYLTTPAPAAPFDDAFFRRRAKAPAKELQRALAYAELAAQLLRELEEHVDLPALQLERSPVAVGANRDVVDEAAAATRRSLGIGSGPAPQLARTLEARGVIVIRNSVVGPTVDAFSRWVGGRPYVVLNAAKNDTMRTRFDIAHELGHLVMHDSPGERDGALEKQADQFAAAFLMPAEGIAPHLPERPRCTELLKVKDQWGVSVAALLRRARDLDVITEYQYKKANIELAQLGWKKREPGGSSLGSETPVLWRRALEVLEGDVSLSDIAASAGIPADRAVDALGFSASDAKRRLEL